MLTPWALAFGVANIPHTSVLMNAAPTVCVTRPAPPLGIAVISTLIANFTSNNYFEKLHASGFSSSQISQVVNVLKSAIKETIQQKYPLTDPEIVKKLVESFKVANSDAVISTMLISALVIFIAAGLVCNWMHGRADEPLTEVAMGE